MRVVVLNRETGETFTEDIGDDNPVAIYVAGHARARLRGADRLSLLLLRHRGVRPGRPRRARRRVERPARRRTCGARDRRSCRSGTRLRRRRHGRGRAARPRARSRRSRTRAALTRADWDVDAPAAAGARRRPRPARGRVDRRRRRGGRPAGGGCRQRRRRAARGRARRAARRLVERLRLRRHEARAVRRVGRAAPLGAYGRTKLHGEAAAGEQAWIVRSLLALRLDVEELRPHDAAPRRRARRGGGRRRPARLARPTSATWRRRRRRCSSCRSASTTSRRRATAPGPSFAEAIFEEAGLDARVRRITSGEFGARAARPAYSVLRSERGAPELPHWRDGLRDACAAVSTL